MRVTDPDKERLLDSQDENHGTPDSATYGGGACRVGGVTTEVKVSDDDTEVSTENERSLSNTMVFIHLFKAFTGPSTLGTPAIMHNGGLLLAPLGFILIGYVNTWCNATVVKCCNLLCNSTGRSSMSFEDLMEESFRLSKVTALRRLSPYIRKITKAFLVITQFGIISFYIKTIGTTAHKYVCRASAEPPFPLIVTELFVCLLIIPYSWMRNLRALYWFSLTANILMVVSIVTIVQFACRSLQPISSVSLVTPDPWSVPLFVGACIFTVEGIPMVLPLENKARNPMDFGGLCGILTLASTCNICLNVAVGFYGYLAVGDDVTGNILVHLPDGGIYDALGIALSVAVFLTYSLQLYLPAEVMTSALRSKVKAEWMKGHIDWVSRTALVIASYLFAALVPDMELLMSLVGSFATGVLVFVFPPLAEICVMSRQPGGIPSAVIAKDVVILTFGGLAFITGTYSSIKKIVEAF